MAAPGQVNAADVLRRLEWQVLRKLDGRVQGSYRTLFPGQGIDVKDLRDYEAGDDVRHIDWNVTARMDTPYVRQYNEDREITAWLLLDRSSSMHFGPVDRPKDQVLTEVVSAIAGMLVHGGNRVGAILYNNGVEKVIPAATGRKQALRLTHDMLVPPAKTEAATDLSGLVNAAHGVVKRRSLIVLVSDFISAPGWEKPLALLGQRHEVVAVQLVDPREFELPEAGFVVVEDAETGEQVWVDTNDPEFRARLHQVAVDRQHELYATARRAGVDLHTVSTTDDLVTALLRITERRKRSRRR